MKRVFLALSLLFIGSLGLIAQSANLQKANKYYRELNFQKAIPLYEKILQKQMQPQALFNLPDCFRRIGDFQSAEYWYAQAAAHPEANPELHFYLGLMRLSNGKTREARTSFEKFRELEPSDTRSSRLILACTDSVRNDLQNAGLLYQLNPVEELNTPFDEFGVAFFDKGIVFCSERDTGSSAFRRSAWTGRPFVDVFYIPTRLTSEEELSFSYGKINKFELNTRLHDGPLSFGPSQREVYLSRNKLNKKRVVRDKFGIIKVDIVQGKLVNDKWVDFKSLPFCSPGYSVLHPSVSSDGSRLYFASDMEGGFGGLDLYVSYNDGGGWSSPINLGPAINTEGDEVFPFVDSTGMLYFSSDGHAGLGGFDIYYSKATKGVWAPLRNIGAPINSPKDDIGFVLHPSRKFGYVSSNRDGGAGNTDIYYFKKLTVQTEILVFDKTTGKGIEGVMLRSDCLPRDTFVTTIDGKINLELPVEQSCLFKVISEEFADVELSISTKGYPIGSELFKQLPIELEQLKFSVEGLVVDQEDGKPITGVPVKLISSCSSEELEAELDEEGKFSFELSGNCCYVLKVAKDGYFTGTEQFCTKGKFKSEALESRIELLKFYSDAAADGGNPNSPRRPRLNTDSRYVIENIYYRTGSADLRIDSYSSLDKVYELLLNNPEYGVEVSAHTDSRGDETMNLQLSIRRAKAVANYLLSKGIDEERVLHVGYGEYEPINNCKDGVPCSEQKHQANRRTEFRIFKLEK